MSSKRTFALDQLLSSVRIIDGRFDLSAVTNNAFVSQQTIDIARGEARYLVEIEVMKRQSEVFALSEDGAPAQPGLKNL